MSQPPPGYHGANPLDSPYASNDYAQWVEASEDAQHRQYLNRAYGRTTQLSSGVPSITATSAAAGFPFLHSSNVSPLPQQFHPLAENIIPVASQFRPSFGVPSLSRHQSLLHSDMASFSLGSGGLAQRVREPQNIPSSSTSPPEPPSHTTSQSFTFSHYSPLDYMGRSGVSGDRPTIAGDFRDTSPSLDNADSSSSGSSSVGRSRKRKRVENPNHYVPEEALNVGSEASAEGPNTLTRK